MAAVDQLRYTPNFGARAIAANRTGIYGAVIPTMENAIFARGIEAFQAALVARNATMIVASSAYDPEQESKLIRTMVGRGADGMLLIGTERHQDTYAFLEDRNIPYVVAWTAPTGASHAFVGFDNRAASRSLVTEALSFGHRQVACIYAPVKSNDRSRERLIGARDAFEEFDLSPDAIPVIETEYAIQNGQNAFNRLIKADKPPTLIICGNDVLAVGVVQAAQTAGLRVPEDLSVIGFDDIELATVISPALTTVHVPHGEMGRLAAEALLKLVDDPETPVRTTLNTEIIRRASLAPPKT